ncbi:hypothetical protein J3A83DRAFT_4188165 [Scleroderma citrinum]
MSSINYTLDTTHFTQGVPSLVHGMLFAGKKREQQELGDDQLPGGKGALLALAQQPSEEYKSISVEKKALIEEYTPYKGHKTFGVCATTKSKVNDITKTLKAIENEIHFIFFHVLLADMSINFPLCGVAFATKGVENFMGTVMHIDNHDLMPLQIINNAPPKCEVQSKKSSILSCRKSPRNPGPKCIMIEGWPDHIPFMNLSTVSSALLDLEMLLRMWESGSIFWNQLSEEEYKALHLKCDAKLNSEPIQTRGQTTMATTPATTATTLATTAGPAPCSAAKQTSCLYYPNPPLTLHIPEIDLDLALHNLDKNYGTIHSTRYWEEPAPEKVSSGDNGQPARSWASIDQQGSAPGKVGGGNKEQPEGYWPSTSNGSIVQSN